MIDEDSFRQLEGVVQGHHSHLRKLDEWKASIPDAETLRHMEHVVKEMPSTDKIKEAVEHAENHKRMMWRFMDSLLTNAGKLVWIAAAAGALALLDAFVRHGGK